MSSLSSLREQLAAAMTGTEEPEAAPVVEAAAPVEAAPTGDGGTEVVTPAPEAAEKPETPPEAAADGAPKRDEQGRFAPKDTPSEPAPVTAAEPPPGEPLRIPSSLPAPLKAKFHELPQEWRDAILKQDEDRTAAKAQWDTKAAQFNRLEEVIGPRREQLTLAGVSDVQYLQTLFAADDWLKKDAPSAIAYLANSYGVDLRQFGQQPAGYPQAPQGAPPLDAALQPILKEVQTLKQSLQQREQAEADRQSAAVNAEIAAFAADPAHLYFSDVQGHIAALLESGQAETLQDAYDQAVWASPTIRPLLLEAQAKEANAAQAKAAADAKAKVDAEARAKAAAAGKAAGSVAGAPGQAVAPPKGSLGSIRADLEAAMGQ